MTRRVGEVHLTVLVLSRRHKSILIACAMCKVGKIKWPKASGPQAKGNKADRPTDRQPNWQEANQGPYD